MLHVVPTNCSQITYTFTSYIPFTPSLGPHLGYAMPSSLGDKTTFWDRLRRYHPDNKALEDWSKFFTELKELACIRELFLNKLFFVYAKVIKLKDEQFGLPV